MIAFFANLFGYVLNFLYEFVNNFGLAIILFSILVNKTTKNYEENSKD